MEQPTLKSGQSSPWIRSKEVTAILSSEYDGNPQDGEARLLTALQSGLIRGQARFARFHFQAEERKLPNWPVPEWVWRLRDGRFSLAEDRFHALVCDSDSPSLGRVAEFKYLQKIDLFEFKIHRDELLRHFDIRSVAQQTLAAPVRFTIKAKTDCIKWLEAAFAADSAQLKRKADFKREALDHFGATLSPNAFENTWRDVVERHPQRAKPGRPANR